MLVQRAFKTKLRLNDKERGIMVRYANAARFMYNQTVLLMDYEYKKFGRTISAYGCKKKFTQIKENYHPEILDGVPRCIIDNAIIIAEDARKKFWQRGNKGYPKLKKKSHRKSFRLSGGSNKQRTGSIVVEDDRVRIPVMGWIRLEERGYIPQGRYSIATISEYNDNWYISVMVGFESENSDSDNQLIILGIDFGIKKAAVCSNGVVFENPKPLIQAEKKIARLNRELSRRCRGSQNWRKTNVKLRKAHAKVRNIRNHFQHDLSSYIVENADIIVLEDLNVRGMTKNHKLAKALCDVGFGELRRQIEYKAEQAGAVVIIADRFFPSSKTCSHCGCIKDELTLAERTFVCDDCGFMIDRDLNAAKNLAALGRTCEQRGIACGVGVS